MSYAQILYQRLTEAFPEAVIEVYDPRRDDAHLEVVVTSSVFSEKSRLQRHRMVYAVLEDLLQPEGGLHALSIRTCIP